MKLRFVKLIVPGSLLIALGVVLMSFGKSHRAKSDVITFYKVPLVCTAAPDIGCGTRSKPILLGLEKSPMVKEAWLNRSGTVIAVVWEGKYGSDQQATATDAVFAENRIDITKILRKERKKLIRDFKETNNWYRGAAVDELSLEEAETIAKRIVTRINAKAPLSESLQQTLNNQFTGILKKCFTATNNSEINYDKARVAEFLEEIGTQLKEVAKEHLNEKEMAAFNEAMAPANWQNETEGDQKSCCSPSKKESCTVADKSGS